MLHAEKYVHPMIELHKRHGDVSDASPGTVVPSNKPNKSDAVNRVPAPRPSVPNRTCTTRFSVDIPARGTRAARDDGRWRECDRNTGDDTTRPPGTGNTPHGGS